MMKKIILLIVKEEYCSSHLIHKKALLLIYLAHLLLFLQLVLMFFDISNSYIVIHHDRELARAFLNTEPYNKLFVENNVKVIFSEEEEEEEEEDELTFKDIINQNFKSDGEKIQKYIFERLKYNYLSKFKEKIKF